MDRVGAWVDRWAFALFALMASAAFTYLIRIGRHSTFFGDEWAFIGASGLGSPVDWLTPHNQHWSTIPFLVYRMLMLTVGMRTYLPYLALLLAIHVVASAGLFVLVRRSAGSLLAVAAAMVFLLLGSGWQNLFWAFQIGFLGSAAAGLWALVVFDPRTETRRPWLGALLLLISIMCSGMGLPFVVMAFVEVMLDRRRRREAAWVAAVGVTFAAWYVTFGRTGSPGAIAGAGSPSVLDLARFVAEGFVGSIYALTGLPTTVAASAIVVMLVVAAWLAWHGALDPRVVGAATGLMTLLLLVSVARGGDGFRQANNPRYAYEVVALLLLMIAALIGRRGDVLPAFRDGWRDRPATTTLLVTGVAVALALGLGHNVRLLRSGALFYREAAGELRAEIALAARYGQMLRIQPPVLDRWDIGATPAEISRDAERYGSPARDVLVPSLVLQPTAMERDRALWRLIGGALAPTAAPAVGPPAGTAPPPIAGIGGAVATVEGACDRVSAAPGEQASPNVTVLMRDGQSVVVTVDRGGTGAVGLGRDLPPDPLDRAPATFAASVPSLIHAPQLGDGAVYQVLVILPAGTSTGTICTVD